jgi:hypothetical protein
LWRDEIWNGSDVPTKKEIAKDDKRDDGEEEEEDLDATGVFIETPPI